MKKLIATVLIMAGSFSWASEQQTTSPGVYWVPVGQQLSQFALFDLPEVTVKNSEDKIKIEYNIPQELTGTVNRVEFEGRNVPGAPVVLRGNYGKMECSAPGDFSNCAVTYKNLKFNTETRAALLQSISRDSDELRKRELVAARFQFGGEPHGFVRVLKH